MLIAKLDWVVKELSVSIEKNLLKALAAKFHAAMLDTYHVAKTDCGYTATYFLQMVSELGGVEAAHRLLASANPATGLTELWLCNRLDLSVEAQVLRPEFAPLFSEEERTVAQTRLAEYGYAVQNNRRR